MLFVFPGVIHVDMTRAPDGIVSYTVLSAFIVFVFTVNSFWYTFVCVVIKRSHGNVARYQDSGQLRESRRTMHLSKSLTLIVADYISQY